MPTSIEFFDVADERRITQALSIRFAVFVDEQRVPAEEEIDDHDRTDPAAVHAIVVDTFGAAVATGRYYPCPDDTVQIGRMAVLEAARGQQIGIQLLNALMEHARARGYSRAILWAQVHALTFYHKAGFAEHGDRFLDGGIAHQAMSRSLKIDGRLP